MKRIAQVITATGFVSAVVRPSGAVAVPPNMTFIEIEDDQPDVSGWTWDGEAFNPPEVVE